MKTSLATCGLALALAACGRASSATGSGNASGGAHDAGFAGDAGANTACFISVSGHVSGTARCVAENGRDPDGTVRWVIVALAPPAPISFLGGGAVFNPPPAVRSYGLADLRSGTDVTLGSTDGTLFVAGGATNATTPTPFSISLSSVDTQTVDGNTLYTPHGTLDATLAYQSGPGGGPGDTVQVHATF